MIPADRILIDGDTAWWIVPGLPATEELQARPDPPELLFLNRPCDTCGGKGMIEFESFLMHGVPTTAERKCPADCINGRHTFVISVRTPCTDCPNCEAFPNMPHDKIDRYRVSIVPDMVLPIVGEALRGGGRSGVELGTSDAEHDFPNTLWINGQWSPLGDLPPAAAPGMWAVKLKIIKV